MTAREIIRRAVATFVQAFTATLTATGFGIIDADVWQQASVAGLTALATFLHRVSGAILAESSRPELELDELRRLILTDHPRGAPREDRPLRAERETR